MEAVVMLRNAKILIHSWPLNNRFEWIFFSVVNTTAIHHPWLVDPQIQTLTIQRNTRCYTQMFSCVESALLNPVMVQGSMVFRREIRQDLLMNLVQDLRRGVKDAIKDFGSRSWKDGAVINWDGEKYREIWESEGEFSFGHLKFDISLSHSWRSLELMRSNESCKFGSHLSYRWYLKSQDWMRSARKWVRFRTGIRTEPCGSLMLRNHKEQRRMSCSQWVKKETSPQIPIRNSSSSTVH